MSKKKSGYDRFTDYQTVRATQKTAKLMEEQNALLREQVNLQRSQAGLKPHPTSQEIKQQNIQRKAVNQQIRYEQLAKRELVKNQKVALLLAVFLGFYGADMFYLENYPRAVGKFFTCGGLFVLWIKDIIDIANKNVPGIIWDTPEPQQANEFWENNNELEASLPPANEQQVESIEEDLTMDSDPEISDDLARFRLPE